MICKALFSRAALSLITGLFLTFTQPTLAQTNTNAVTVTAEVTNTNGVRSVTTVVNDFARSGTTFGLDRVPALRREVMGIPLWQYTASAIFILLALNVSKFLEWTVGGQLRRWSEKRNSKLGLVILQLIHGPIKVVTFVVLLHVGLRVFDWPAWLAIYISRALQVVVACSITYMVLKCIDVLVDYWRQRGPTREDRNINDHLLPVVSKSLKAFVVIVAILMTCQNAFHMDITAMLASLSIGGLALGLAAQDTVANLFGAVAVFVDKPFRMGDRIRLENIDGTVEEIGLRSTRIRSLDGYLITVPNKTMGNATIINVTRRPTIKTEMNIGITYDTPAEKVSTALAILEETYRKHPMTHDLVIGFNRFADSALNINIIHWWRNTDHRAYIAGMQELNLAVKRRFDKEGIEFAFPTQTLYVKTDKTDGNTNGHLGQV